MGDQHRLNNRIDGALSALFDSLLPVDPATIDDATTLRWLEGIIQKATNVVHDGQDNMPEDINLAQDLIKRKLLRQNSSPEKAARFSNLYSRLLSMPVLNQKWRILYLLYSLSEEQAPASALKSAALGRSEEARTARDRFTPQFTREDSPNQDDSVSQRGPRYDSESPEREPLRRVSDERDLVGERKQLHEQSRLGLGPELEQEDEHKDQVPTESHDMQSKFTETDLMRDLPFNLQGFSSNSFQFASNNSVRLPTNLPVPTLSLLSAIAEPCLLYRSLDQFTEARDGGLVTQALRATISTELRLYLSLVATLESEIRRAVAALSIADAGAPSIRSAGITLKRIYLHLRDPTYALRLLSLIVSSVQSATPQHGGRIITTINTLATTHGDPFVISFCTRMLASVTTPFYQILRSWIYDGELLDPFSEFFVVLIDPETKPEVDSRRVATSIWEDKYRLEASLVPSIITPDFANKIFLIGKSLNFIRHNCGDSIWVMDYSRKHSQPIDHSNTNALSTSIDTAYQSTMSRLTYLMYNKFHLRMHLLALKKYLLLAQGDFINLLVESLAPNLDRPAHSQYRHTLTSQLEHAIRHSNAQFDDVEVLSRLDARMIELTRGDTGWDCFTLEYKVSPPCDVIITQWASTQYLKIFNVMLRIKRVEYSLNQTWRRTMTGARGVLADISPELGADWKRARCLIAEMVHFVNQLQYYILFEVVEASWEKLQVAMDKENATLDDLIQGHTDYINTIVQKGLLASSAERADGFLVQLHGLLKGMLAYRDVVESLYSHCVGVESQKRAYTAQIERRTAQGKWGVTEQDSISRTSTPATGGRVDRWPNVPDHHEDTPAPLSSGSAGDDQTLLVGLRKRMQDLSQDWRSRINNFLYDLAHQPDVDLRFLGVVMNFNEAYKPSNPRRLRRRERGRLPTGREKDKDETVSQA